MLGTVLHMHRGTPYVYQGEELGMTNGDFRDIDDFRDIEAINEYNDSVALGEDPQQILASLRFMSRDNGRTPMQWDDTIHAGFSTGQPWIGVNPNYEEINAETQVLDKDSVFWHYKRLVELRRTEPVVAHGDFTMLLDDHPYVYAFTRRLDDVELLVLGNFSAEQQPVDLPDVDVWRSSEPLITNVPQEQGKAPSLHLAPWEARVYRREL
jgi:oligo-1,6-glucosidase